MKTLSSISRLLTFNNAVLYAVLGALLFILPEQLAPVFAWKISAFVTMTIGGWCLGNAWLAWHAARRWEWGLVYTSLIYLWLFGFTEMGVLIAFRDKLVLQHPIAWLYFVTLIVNVIAAIVGIVDWLRTRPIQEQKGKQVLWWQRAAVLVFVLLVGFLGAYDSTNQLGDPGTNADIFPELMSLFTLRSFGLFYLSLALAAVPLLWERNLNTLLSHGFAAYGLIVFITAAAFVYLPLFDFAANAGGLLYFGAYLAVGVPLFFVFLLFGTGTR
jgi:hypothetical protein